MAQHGLFQLELGDAERQQAADLGILVVDDGLHAVAHEHVGAGQADVVGALGSFHRRVMLDLNPIRPRRGVDVVQADFREYRPPAAFDLVLCLQVLEHLAEPEAFARRLFDIGRTVIISVPYEWPEGAYPLHVQDPVDEAKLERWTGRQPTVTRIVADERERLIAVYVDGGKPIA